MVRVLAAKRDTHRGGVGNMARFAYDAPQRAAGRPSERRPLMAKGQQKSNKEARKPKKAKVKTIAANPSA